MIYRKLFPILILASTGIYASCGSSRHTVASNATLAHKETSTKNGTSSVEAMPTDSGVVISKEIVWLDFETGYAKAVKENKILLVDVYTDWCGWCKVMDRETYTDAEVIQAVNKDFVTVKLNPEKNRTYKFGDKSMAADELHQWLGYGQTFGYPTTYFWVKPSVNEDRYSQSGYLEPDQFKKILTIVLSKKG
jgi:thioredoxin-related protein